MVRIPSVEVDLSVTRMSILMGACMRICVWIWLLFEGGGGGICVCFLFCLIFFVCFCLFLFVFLLSFLCCFLFVFSYTIISNARLVYLIVMCNETKSHSGTIECVCLALGTWQSHGAGISSVQNSPSLYVLLRHGLYSN